jgi:hypothetical protein
MCEGFIDGQTSLAITCKTGFGNLYDYRFRNLCFDAFSGTFNRRFLPGRSRRRSGQGSARSRTRSCMPMFTTGLRCWNLLTRARVMLPFGVECRTQNFTGVNGQSRRIGKMDMRTRTPVNMRWSGPARRLRPERPMDPPQPGRIAASASAPHPFVNRCTMPVRSGFSHRRHNTTADYRVALVTGWENASRPPGATKSRRLADSSACYQHETQGKCETVSVSGRLARMLPELPGALQRRALGHWRRLRLG